MSTPTLRSIALADPRATHEIVQGVQFTLEHNDTKSDRGMVLARLYDREIEKEQLLRAFRRISSSTSSNPELVIITGSSGTGKTELAQGLKEDVISDGGIFLQGKWDQFQSPVPYAPLVSAFTDFANSIMKQGDQHVAAMKTCLEKSTESDYQLLTDMIPALKQILTAETIGKSAKGVESHTRFKMIFRKFVNAISSPERPVVLLLDDLQWADVGSLDLIKTIVMDHSNTGFMILGTCRGHEVAIDDPLSIMLREIEDSNVIVTDIQLTNLCHETVNTMIVEMFNLPDETSSYLSKIVFDQTGGNGFYVMQFLRTLQAQNLLRVDKDTGKWTWDQTNTQVVTKPKDVVELVGEKMESLPHHVREMLKFASCLGAEFDEQVLHGVVQGDIPALLSIAEANGLLLLDSSSGACRWTHDKVQQAAYQQILKAERTAFHLELGRKLWTKLSSDDLAVNVFLVIHQLHLGIPLMDEQEEKDRMAALCLQAGELAMKSSAFAAASWYLDMGTSLLSQRHWRDNYDLSLSLFCASCEIEFCNANFAKMDAFISEILENAKTFRDGLRALTTKVHAFGARNKPDCAIKTGMEVLKKLGQHLPAKARTLYIVMDFIKTKRMLRKFSMDQIMSLPVMEDEDHLAATKMLSLLYPYTFICQQAMAPLITFRLIQLTITYGISPISSAAFACYGMLLCASFHDLHQGYQYGQLAMRLQKHFDAPEWYPRTVTPVHGMINPWKDNMKLSIDPLMAAHRIGLATGDIEFAMLSAALHATLSVYAGRSLREVAEENWKFHDLMLHNKQTQMISLFLPIMQVVLNLMGRGHGVPWELTGEVMNEQAELESAFATKSVTATIMIRIYKQYLAYYVGEYEEGVKAAKLLRGCKLIGRSPYSACMPDFLEGMTAISIAHQSNKRRNRRLGLRRLKSIKKLELVGPDNVKNKVALLEAEIFFLEGKVAQALGSYDKAIDFSAKQGIINEQALACERKAYFLESIGQYTAGLDFLQQARALYAEWGSSLKVDHLSKRLLNFEKSYPAAEPDDKTSNTS